MNESRNSRVGGTPSFFDIFVYDVVGPTVGSLQLSGPLNLKGWDFLLAALSSALLIGYLQCIGTWCGVRGWLGMPSRKEIVQYVLALLPVYIPAAARCVMRIRELMQTTSS